MSLASAPSRRRAYWLKTLHEWHWVSSALCLVGLLLFSITGFTLNHAGQIEAKPKVESKVVQLDKVLLGDAARTLPAALAHQGKAELPASLRTWIRERWDVA